MAAAPGAVSVKLEALTEAASISSLKVADTAALRATPLAPFAGWVSVTVGRVVSGDPSMPSTGSRLLPPQPAVSATRRRLANHSAMPEKRCAGFM